MSQTTRNRLVVIVHGDVPANAPEDEKDVLVEAGYVAASLSRLGFIAVTIPVSLDLAYSLDRVLAANPYCVFNLVETLAGKGRYLPYFPYLLEERGVPFSGAPAEALLTSTNKLLAKNALLRAGLPTPAWMPCTEIRTQKSLTFDPPYIVKSIWEHASVGLDESSVLFSRERALERALAMDPLEAANLFMEQYIEGREFNLSVVVGTNGPELFPCAEIRFEGYEKGKTRIVDYKAKWMADSVEYRSTPRTFEFKASDTPLLAKLRKLALDTWHAFSMEGYARVDFRVDTQGNPFILELNANPCISPDGGFAAAALQQGLDYDKLVKVIIDDCARRYKLL